MVQHGRRSKNIALSVDALETRNLLSLLGSKPTLDAIIGPGVHRNHQGGISITQPAMISVFGTAQPGPAGATVAVSIYAEDAQGNIVNGGAPLAAPRRKTCHNWLSSVFSLSA